MDQKREEEANRPGTYPVIPYDIKSHPEEETSKREHGVHSSVHVETNLETCFVQPQSILVEGQQLGHQNPSENPTCCCHRRVSIYLLMSFGGIIVASVVAMIVHMTLSSAKTNPTNSPRPRDNSAPTTLAPSSNTGWDDRLTHRWTLSAELLHDDSNRNGSSSSFGYNVQLSNDGSIMAVAAPKYNSSHGRIYIYQEKQQEEGQMKSSSNPNSRTTSTTNTGADSNATVTKMNWVLVDDPLEGEQPGDLLGMTMALSRDGSTIAVRSPGRSDGLVQVYSIILADEDDGTRVGGGGGSIQQKGEPLTGFASSANITKFRHDIALNGNGTRLFVTDSTQQDESVRAYDYDDGEQQWVQVGNTMTNPNGPATLFGVSISSSDLGDRIVIGAPPDDERHPDGGKIFSYELKNLSEWETMQERYPKYYVGGSNEGSMVGERVAINSFGDVIVTKSQVSTYNIETFPAGAGQVEVWKMCAGLINRTAAYIGDPCISTNDHDGVEIVRIPITGIYTDEALGYDLDTDSVGTTIIASGVNDDVQSGSVSFIRLQEYSQSVSVYELLVRPALGDKVWLGKGPSVALSRSRSKLRFAVGYENIQANGNVSHSAVRIFDSLW